MIFTFGTDEGYSMLKEWVNDPAYVECSPEESTHQGLNGESLKKTLQGGKEMMLKVTPFCTI